VTGPRVQRVNPPDYRAAQEAARAQESSLSHQALEHLARALQVYADELFREISHLADLPDQLGRLRQIRRAFLLIQQAQARLDTLFYQTVRDARDASFREILDIWRDAGRAAARRVRLPRELVAGVPETQLPLAGAFEALGTPPIHWRTLLTGYTENAVEETQLIVREALLRGMPSRELALRLRPYVLGAETFFQAFGRTELSDQLLQTPGFQQAARKLLFNADRIAYSEIHNARHEAERQRFAADPLVGAVGWRLSANRGSTRIPDVCDYLARDNFYGLGPGVYPIVYAPLPPHPHDRCELVPIVRPAYRAGEAKPEGQFQFDPLALEFPEGTTAARAGLIRRQLERALIGVQVHPIAGRVRTIIQQKK